MVMNVFFCFAKMFLITSYSKKKIALDKCCFILWPVDGDNSILNKQKLPSILLFYISEVPFEADLDSIEKKNYSFLVAKPWT